MDYAKANNTYFGTLKDDPTDRIEIEVGDSKELTFKPQIKIMRWDNEINCSIRLISKETVTVASAVDNKISWNGEGIGVKFYEDLIDINQGYEKEWYTFKDPYGSIVTGRMIGTTALILDARAGKENNSIVEKAILKLSEKGINYMEAPIQTDSVVLLWSHLVDKGVVSNPEFNEYSKIYPSRWEICKKYKSLEVNELYEESAPTNFQPGYEFDIILKEKPKSNVIQFSVQDKGVVYYYQPELSEKEKREGAYRPEMVVGSYAIYSTEEKVNYVGGNNYGSGKVGHIYRPEIEDSVGTKVWGELYIENGILSVTIPQDFLDNAVYPIRHAAGLNFGYTTAGASGDACYQNMWQGSVFTAPQSGTIDSISAGIICPVSINKFKSLLVVHSGLTINTNGVGSAITILSGSVWRTSAFSTPPSVTSGTDYVLGIVSQRNAKINASFYYDTGATDQGHSETDNNYVTPTNPTSITHSTKKYSVYATYTESGTTHEAGTFVALDSFVGTRRWYELIE